MDRLGGGQRSADGASVGLHDAEAPLATQGAAEPLKVAAHDRGHVGVDGGGGGPLVLAMLRQNPMRARYRHPKTP